MADDDDFSTMHVSAGQLRSIIERVERLEEERKEVSEQVKEVFAEAKGNGFDVKTLRKIIALRKIKPEVRSEQEAMLELYMNALGMLGGMSVMSDEPPLEFPKPLPVQQKGRKPLTPTVVEDASGPHPAAPEATDKPPKARRASKSAKRKAEGPASQDLSPAAAAWAASQAAGAA